MGGTHPGLRLPNLWDQCLIYVENAEILTFLKPAPAPVLCRPERPRGRSWSLGWGFPGLGWADWTPPPPVHRLSSLRPSWSTEGIHTNLFIESAAPTWLCHLPVRPSVRPSVRLSIHPSIHPALMPSSPRPGLSRSPSWPALGGGGSHTHPVGPTHCEGWVFGEQLLPTSPQLAWPRGPVCCQAVQRSLHPAPLAASPADPPPPVPALGLVGQRASRKTSASLGRPALLQAAGLPLPQGPLFLGPPPEAPGHPQAPGRWVEASPRPSLPCECVGDRSDVLVLCPQTGLPCTPPSPHTHIVLFGLLDTNTKDI